MNKHMFVVCAYQESPYLEACIRSVLDQDQPSPVIVSTSTPNAHVKAVCRKYSLTLNVSDAPGGIAVDWNAAVAAADAEYVTLCHQDDLYDRNYSSCILSAIEKHNDHLIVFTDYRELHGNVSILSNGLLKIKSVLLYPLRFRAAQKSHFFRRMSLRFGNPICCPSVTYHKAILPLPLFEEGLKSNLDWQTWEKLSRLDGRFAYIQSVLMSHRIHEASETSRVIRDHARMREDERMFLLFWPRPIARMLAHLYSKSEKYNNV